MEVKLPIRAVSILNSREHWRVRHKRNKEQQGLVLAAIKPSMLPALPAIITFTRMGPRKLDSDNLAGSMKYLRDQVAKIYGVDDGDDRYEWRYEQEKCKEYWVKISAVAAAKKDA